MTEIQPLGGPRLTQTEAEDLVEVAVADDPTLTDKLMVVPEFEEAAV